MEFSQASTIRFGYFNKEGPFFPSQEAAPVLNKKKFRKNVFFGRFKLLYL